MMRGWILTAVLFGAAGLAAAPAALAQMPEMGAPEEMKAMAGMVGEYDVAFEYKMTPEADYTLIQAQASITAILDGACQRMDFKGDMMGMPMHGIGWTTYSRGLGKYQATWVDNLNASISYYEGTRMGDKLVFTGEDYGPDGSTVLGRHTYSDITDNSHKWTMEMSADGGTTWTTWARATYTRKGAEKSDAAESESGGW
jgi:hypothetical protein